MSTPATPDLRHDFDPARSFAQARAALEQFASDAAQPAVVARAVDACVHALRTGGKVLCVGNGGSACDAAHFAEELTGRFRADRPPIAALACSDAGHITCTANDYGFEHVFARWVLALGRAGDTLVALSTSGNSPNVLRAIDAARERRMTVISLLGKGGGAARGRGTIDIVVPGATADRVQELHKLVLHTMVEGIEHGLGYVARG